MNRIHLVPEEESVFVLRGSDGRIIDTAATREEAREIASQIDTVAAINRETIGPEDCEVEGSGETGAMIEALEYLLSLDPAKCEETFMRETREKFYRNYPKTYARLFPQEEK